MISSTDYLGLNKHTLFKNVRENLPEEIIRTQNVLTVRDGVLYTWDFQDNCVLTLNIKEARCHENDGIPHQAQSAAYLVIEKYELCKDIPDQEVLFYLTPKDFNRGLQLVTINMSLPFPAGENLMMKVILHSEVLLPVKSWVPLFTFEDKLGFCHTLDAYFGEVAYAMERSFGVMPKVCPLPKILLPTSHTHFPVELLRVNSSNTLLVIAGSNGVLVMELPERCPPHGAFANNKEMIYCRSHSLDERLLTCHPSIQIRQVRFHPASQNNTHILVLTSDNALRLYNVVNASAVALGVYTVGQRPTGVMPGTKSFFLGLLGETAVDFDFGPPELSNDQTSAEENFMKGNQLNSILKSSNRSLVETKAKDTYQKSLKRQFVDMSLAKVSRKEKWEDLEWPVYLLDGDGFVLMIKIALNNTKSSKVKGPLPVWPKYENKYTNPACSILCLPCTPPMLCIATINGTIFHSIVLPIDIADEKLRTFRNTTEYSDPPDRAVYMFEGLGLELGLAAVETKPDYACPVFLHADDSRAGHYFATHEAGVHSITVPALETLQQFVKGPEDENLMRLIVNQPSSADYLLCTKMASSREVNPVIGFSMYYDPTSIIALLANGQVVTSLVVSFSSLPCTEDLQPEDIENFNSPLKKMLSEPFDLQIQKILKQVSSQPILKLSGGSEKTQQESYELLQRAAQVFREEYFKHHEKAREEIEKRIKVLQMLKRYQTGEVKKLNEEKQALQEKAENLAEKYEDIKDKQEDLKKRCEKLLILISQRKSEPSEAEKKFLKDLKDSQEKIKKFEVSIGKLRKQTKYQEVQMENWKKEQHKKESGLGSIQSDAIRNNLQDMTNKITDMINEVTEYKQQLGLN